MAIHTDTLNEAGFVEDTIAAFDGRTIHTYHSEGAGGGHAPDISRSSASATCCRARPTRRCPAAINSVAELFDMIMVCHNLNPKIPSDVAFAESRVRAETIAAESVLHDMGVISMICSDSQAMGRVGENCLRAIQTADAMKQARGALPEDAAGNDNFRVLRYVAKVTINPAITHGISHVVGSIEPGKMADLVLWEPAFFGAKPKLVIKGGFIDWAIMGDPNASLPTPQPIYYRPMFGAFGSALPQTCVTFVSRAAYDEGVGEKLRPASGQVDAGVQTPARSASGTWCATARRRSIEVDPQTFAVKVDGVHATVTPAEDDRAQPAVFLQLTARRPDRAQDDDRGSMISRSGNVRRPDCGRTRLERRRGRLLALDQWEAQKSRLRKPTTGGVELAVSLDRHPAARRRHAASGTRRTRARSSPGSTSAR